MNIMNNKSIIVEEQKKNIGIIPSMDMESFATLLLADLASKSPIHYYDCRDIKTAVLSTNYEKIIEYSLYQESESVMKLAEFIDICYYYEFQSDWERKFGKAINQAIKNLNKEYRYDFEHDTIEVDFTQEEINCIKNNL